jgi:hypothetical protein
MWSAHSQRSAVKPTPRRHVSDRISAVENELTAWTHAIALRRRFTFRSGRLKTRVVQFPLARVAGHLARDVGALRKRNFSTFDCG